MGAKKPPLRPADQRVEVFTYEEISKQTAFDHHVLRRVARQLGIEQTIYMHSSYGRRTVGSKRTGVRKRNLGRLIKAAAIDNGKPFLSEFEKDLAGTLDPKLYTNAKRAAADRKAADEEELRKIDALGELLKP